MRRGLAAAGRGVTARRRLHGPVALAVVISLMLAASSPASGARPLRVGFADSLLASSNPSVRSTWLDRAVQARAGMVRINVLWRSIVAGRPRAPANPADPSYDFSSIDAAVQSATARDLAVLFTVYGAPGWAEGGHRPHSAPAGTWRPRAGDFGDFAQALARRYSGTFLGLPRVPYYEAWNEPNLSVYLSPQWKHKKPLGPKLFTRLLNAFYAGVKSAQPDATVVAGGTAPYGDPPGGQRMRPLTFWRKVFCLNAHLRPTRCKTKPHLDALAHHPINTSGGPRRSAVNPNDASTPDFRHVRRILHAAERARHIRPAGHRHQLWATEFWWESDPPEGAFGVGLHRQARWIEEAFHLLWKQGARVAILLQLRDSPGDIRHTVQSGLYFANGKPKPSLKAVRFPFVTERRSRHRLRAWGKAPAAGTLHIERKRHGRWRTIARLSLDKGEVFTRTIGAGHHASLRATVAGKKSLVWRQR